MAESRKLYEESLRLDPTIFQTVYGWARMEETDRNFARAGELLDAAEKISPGDPSVLLHRAILHGRVKDYDKALAALDDIERRREGGLGPIEWSEKGLLLDRVGRYAEAFAAFSEAKRTLRALTGQSYLADEAEMGLVQRHLVGEPAGALADRAELAGALKIIVAQVVEPLDLVAQPELRERFWIGERAHQHARDEAGQLAHDWQFVAGADQRMGA